MWLHTITAVSLSSYICLCLMVFLGATKLHAVCERSIPSSYKCENLADSPNRPAASYGRCALLPTDSKLAATVQSMSATSPACLVPRRELLHPPPSEGSKLQNLLKLSFTSPLSSPQMGTVAANLHVPNNGNWRLLYEANTLLPSHNYLSIVPAWHGDSAF